MNTNRRQWLKHTSALALATALGVPASRVLAAAADIDTALDAFSEGAERTEGLITLTAPEIAENGNTVPISVTVDSPMTEEAYVKSVVILADGNPNPDVATFHFTPASGVAKASTRMRLAKTQNVVVAAKMSDGSVYTDSRNVKVTIGGCGG